MFIHKYIAKNTITKHGIKLFFNTLLLLLACSSSTYGKPNNISSAEKTAEQHEQVVEKIENLPIVFTKNIGQWPQEILYRSNSYGSNVYFMERSLSFGFLREADKEVNNDLFNGQHIEAYEMLVWNLHFLNTSSKVNIHSTFEQNTHSNFMLGNDATRWKKDVPGFGKIKYQNIYEHIDLQYYGTGKSIKYDYILHPKARVEDISMSCEGIKSIAVNKTGELEINTPWGILLERKPVAYQIVNGIEISVDVRFEIKNDSTFGFKVWGSYDKQNVLIIDPVILEWSTFLGGAGIGNGYIFDIAVDAAGNTYATGYYNDNFPVTAGVYDQTYNQGGACGFGGSYEDIYVAKISPDATSLIYATYIGGTCAERGRGIAINSAGEAFVTGWSKSVDFPTVNPYQASNAGSVDAIAFRLNSTGSSLVYSTYLGGVFNEWPEKVAVDASDNVYLVGATLDNGGTANYPTTIGAYQTSFGGGSWMSDGYITKLNSSGGMVYSSYLGGASWDGAYAVAVNASGEAFVTGRAKTGFPTTVGAYQTANNGDDDVFVLKMNAAGSNLVFSTFVGGSAITDGSCPCEVGNYILINSAGESFVTGNVRSSDFPVTSGAYQTTYGGGYYGDAFVFKLNGAGSDLLFSTYLGGSGLEIGWGLDMNSIGELFVAGYTESANYPTTNCAVDSTYNGTTDGDFIVAKFNPTCSTLMYSTYVGGSEQDYWEPKIKVLGSTCDQRAIFCGTTHSQDFPTTAGVLQPVKLNGVNDQPVLFKLKPKLYPGFTISPAPACNVLCTFTDTTSACGNWGNALLTHTWDFGDGSVATGPLVTHTYTASGTFNVKLVVSCPFDSVVQAITVAGGLTLNTNSTPDTCNQSVGTASVSASGGSGSYTYTWSPSGGSASVATGLTSGTYTVTVSDGGPCPTTATVFVPGGISATQPVIQGNEIICLGESTTLSASGAAGYLWSNSSTDSAITVSPVATTTYTVSTVDGLGCTGTDTITVTVKSPSAISVSPESSIICSGASVQLNASGGDTYIWTPSIGLSNASISSPLASPSVTTQYTVTASSNGCDVSAVIDVNVDPLPVAVVSSNVTITEGSAVVLSASGGGTYLWSTSETSSAISVSPVSTTIYCVEINSQNNCTDTACVEVRIEILCGEVFVPNAFSPNDDGNNDLECIFGNCIQTMSFSIYDRWGEKVFSTSDPTQCWDGTFKGKALNSAVFVYYLDATLISGENIKQQGNISLVK